MHYLLIWIFIVSLKFVFTNPQVQKRITDKRKIKLELNRKVYIIRVSLQPPPLVLLTLQWDVLHFLTLNEKRSITLIKIMNCFYGYTKVEYFVIFISLGGQFKVGWIRRIKLISVFLVAWFPQLPCTVGLRPYCCDVQYPLFVVEVD